jgi:exoribonuclease R
VEIDDIEEIKLHNDDEYNEELYNEYNSDDELEDNKIIIKSENKRVVNKVEENNRIYNTGIEGILEINTIKNYGVNKRNIPYFKFKPLNKEYPSFLVASSCKKKYKKNVYCIIQYKEWEITHIYPYGTINNIFGEIDNNKALYTILLYKYDLYNNNYKLTLQDTNLLYDNDKLNKHNILKEKKREKYINNNIISIDPIGCEDIDDAFHCEETHNYYIVYIHIADVSEYVKNGSKIDEYSKKNYQTLYNDDNINMLPKILSNKLCSLSKNNDYNLVITTKYIYDKENLNLLEFSVYESIIKMDYNLCYEKCQNILNEENIGNIDKHLLEVKKSIHILSKLSYTKDIHKIIEYFMVLTNSKICELLYNNLGITIMRNYKKIENIKIENLNDNVNKFLNYYNNGNAKYVLKIKEKDEFDTDNIEHDILNLKYYTHYTSPIRRYIDIELHRLYKKLINKNVYDINIEDLRNKIENINKKNKDIKKYYIELNKLNLIYNIENKLIDKIYEGIIVNIKEKYNNFNVIECVYINIYIEELNIVYNYNILNNNRYKLFNINILNKHNDYELINNITKKTIKIRKYDNVKLELYTNLLKNDINKLELKLLCPNIESIL